MDYIVELIITEDEAMQLVDKGLFRHLLQYLRPSLSDKDIPHHTKTRDEILERARLAVVQTMTQRFKLSQLLLTLLLRSGTRLNTMCGKFSILPSLETLMSKFAY